ncbi:hypothetical protein K466DRAFT_480450 [Polyporus arcularius HHB13444]|uniref:Xylanolytic transcriptional activator regulatory domain-containing protein n=1 Tax=Polyporus arcularius HHB13444 TaxID=1314778 RepID=A0A5C3PSL5_9APHY|nr:hypothetical protein K466DRAFT_480450 [Polyporus arcularius HHB13444]
MSSTEEDNTAPSSKRRKYPRACDYCRRKKSNGPQMPNNRCSKCIYKKIDCTYVEPLHKHFYPSSHVNALESRMQKLERLVKRLNPDIDIARELEEQETPSRPSPSTVSESSQSKRVFPLAGLPIRDQTDYEPSEDESELQEVNLIEEFGKVSLKPASYLYHGKSSSMVLLRAATDLNNMCGKEMASPVLDQARVLPPRPGPSAEFRWLSGTCPDRIPQFHDFPPPDLVHTLIDLYFAEVNAYSPLLHEPTFRRCVSQGLHLSPGGFGATLLLVCATGARWSRDARTLGTGTSTSNWPGWTWFQQVESVYRSVVAPPDVYDLQIRVLMVMYLQGTTVTHACWAIVGAGIRVGVEMGAHRKRRYEDDHSVEGELLKRAFWILVTQDWGMAFTTGRPASIHDEDMDLPLPIECDDEYWTDASGKPTFNQPPGKPSKVSFFICYLRLMQVLAFAVRTVYAINKSRVQLRHGDQQWEERTVAELDSALNRWVDAVPDHLKWIPQREDGLFFKQSATLFSHFYLFQIAVHRPFIEQRKRESPLSFTSIMICFNAAKSAIRVLDELYRRIGTPLHRNVGTLFFAAMVIILHISSEKGAGRSHTLETEVHEVQKCLEMLRAVAQE